MLPANLFHKKVRQIEDATSSTRSCAPHDLDRGLFTVRAGTLASIRQAGHRDFGAAHESGCHDPRQQAAAKD